MTKRPMSSASAAMPSILTLDDVEGRLVTGAFVGTSDTVAVTVFEVPLKLIVSSTLVIPA